MHREYLRRFYHLIPTLDDLKHHHGILVERIHDSFMVKPGWVPLKEERITHKTHYALLTTLEIA
jgi:hypothetical protein